MPSAPWTAGTAKAATRRRAPRDARAAHDLLGKPWRTALSGNGVAAGNGAGTGTLRWTYTWIGSSSSSSERILHVDFTGKTEERWSVSGWNWSAY
jgi:hypothetical protein